MMSDAEMVLTDVQSLPCWFKAKLLSVYVRHWVWTYIRADDTGDDCL